IWFGGLGRSVRSPTAALDQLRSALKNLGVQKLVTVGFVDLPLDGLGLPVQRHHSLSHQAASAILSASRIGVLDYFDGYLGKSGIFAAYCSHGVMPLLFVGNH